MHNRNIYEAVGGHRLKIVCFGLIIALFHTLFKSFQEAIHQLLELSGPCSSPGCAGKAISELGGGGIEHDKRYQENIH